MKRQKNSRFKVQATSPDDVSIVDAFDENTVVVGSMTFLGTIGLDNIPPGTVLGVEATKELCDIVDDKYGVMGYA